MSTYVVSLLEGLEGTAGAFVEFAVELHVLEAAGVDIGAQQVDAQVQQCALR